MCKNELRRNVYHFNNNEFHYNVNYIIDYKIVITIIRRKLKNNNFISRKIEETFNFFHILDQRPLFQM